MPIDKQFSDDLVAGAAIRDGEGNIISSTYEQLTNKVTTLTSTNTDTEYPSAKLVFDQLALKLDKSGGTVTKLTVSSTLKIGANMNANSKRIYGLAAPTGTSDATRKAYVDAADALAEKLANKVTTIDSTSTSTEYPSASAVWDLVQDNTTTIATTIDSSSTNSDAAGAAAVYEYGQNIKDAIVTTLTTTSVNLYQLEPGFYNIDRPVGSPYISIFYKGRNSTDIYNGTYFQVNKEGDIRSICYTVKYEYDNNYYSDMSIIWQSTTNTSIGGYDTWQTVNSSDADTITTLEAQENKVTTLSSSNTDTEYPSAKCVYDAIQAGGGGIPTSALVTSIDSSSTDSQVPSAKCMYDLIGNINTVLATLASIGGGS